jgi:hypothetical protein
MERMIKPSLLLSVFLLLCIPHLVLSLDDVGSAPSYVGSEACKSCHQEHFAGWKRTLHSRMEQPVIDKGDNKTVLGNFSMSDPDLTFALSEVYLLVGSRFKQRYATKIDDEHYLLPAQWNVQPQEWVHTSPRRTGGRRRAFIRKPGTSDRIQNYAEDATPPGWMLNQANLLNRTLPVKTATDPAVSTLSTKGWDTSSILRSSVTKGEVWFVSGVT